MQVYDGYVYTELHIPQRSNLYHLSPIGRGTPTVESLTSYIMRLAKAHSVSTRTLMVDQLFPLFDRPYLRHHSLRLYWHEQARALNGISTSARDMVGVLEHLTGHRNLHLLTMLTWSNVLPPRGLLRQHRAWCPLCYAAWHEHGLVVYEPLIWALEVISICPLHDRELCHQCPSCQSYLLPLNVQSRPGYCDHCHQWLGRTGAGVEEQSRQNQAQAIRITEIVGEMLAQADTVAVPPSRERIAAVVAASVAGTVGGSNAALARLLGCSKYTIRDCCRGEQLLQVRLLLKLAQVIDVSLVRLLTDASLLSSVSLILSKAQDLPVTYTGPYRHIDKEQLRKQLQAAASDPSDQPKSLRVVAEELGFDLSYLIKQYPEETQGIKARHATYVTARKEQTRAGLIAELRQVMTHLVAEGIYPSQKRVAEQMSRTWVFRLPEGRVAWRQMLGELGWNVPLDTTGVYSELEQGVEEKL